MFCLFFVKIVKFFFGGMAYISFQAFDVYEEHQYLFRGGDVQNIS